MQSIRHKTMKSHEKFEVHLAFLSKS